MKPRERLYIKVGCFLAVIYILYNYVLVPVEFVVVPVEVYDLTSTNSFRTIPFYTTSKYKRGKHDVTLITQVSVDRLFRVQNMAESWEGPISAAVYMKNDTLEMLIIDELVKTSNAVDQYVDFHILFANKTRYPVNNLRNLALTKARTSFVMILDADFVTSKNMHEYLSEVGKRSNMLEESRLAYVIPAFSSSLRLHKIPKTKQELLITIQDDTVEIVNKRPCKKCHGPTDYENWYTATEPYEAEYRWIYEPYLMLNKDNLAELFDERLKGYGFDKNTHVFALATAGYRFFVLPEPFVIHLNHDQGDWDGGSIQTQLWEALDVVCALIPETKKNYGYQPDVPLFDEPVGDTCKSKDHW